jgi:hypothetical protein
VSQRHTTCNGLIAGNKEIAARTVEAGTVFLLAKCDANVSFASSASVVAYRGELAMRNRIVSAALLSVSLAMFAGSADAGTRLVKSTKTKAAPAAGVSVTAHSGSVMSVEKGKLTITDKATSKEHVYVVPATAKITIGGKAAKLEDLKKGTMVNVNTDAKGAVEAVSSS